MLSVSDRFNAIARASVRELNWRVMISFDRQFNDDITFFTLDTSVLDGPDFLQGEGGVVQEWDKYEYVDYTDRLMHMEWSREEGIISGISLGMADIVLDNHDDFFTPGSGSAVDGNVLPARPVRLYAGFGDELIPVLIGLTEGMGKIDENDKTISFHIIDFLRYILDRPIDQATLQIDARVDTVLDELLQAAGLVPSQYVLDVGQNTISFAYFERGTKLGTAVNKLMEAEFGRFFMDANGLLQFKNRENYAGVPVYSFSKNNTLSMTRRESDDIINVVEIAGRRRVVGSLQDVGQLGTPKYVAGSGSTEIWIDFVDPVTSVQAPVYYTSSTDSYFKVNEQEDDTGSEQASAVTLTDLDLFTGSCKLTFTNSSSVGYWVTAIKLFGTPARAVGEMFIREADEDSVTKYDEHVYHIDNDFFQDLQQAQSKALILLDDHAEYAPAEQLTVKGNMALETGDPVTVFQDATLTTTNLATNPSLETNTTGWSGYQASIARSSSEVYSGTYSLAVTISAISPDNPVAILALTGLTSGARYRASAYVKATAGRTIFVNSNQLTGSYAQMTSTGGWDLLASEAGTATGTTANVEIGVVGGSVSEVFYVDAVMFVSGTATVPTYFDGNSADSNKHAYTWSGTANNSSSTHTYRGSQMQEYAITKSTNIMDGKRYTQRLELKQFNRREYFILDQSLLDSGAALAP